MKIVGYDKISRSLNDVLLIICVFNQWVYTIVLRIMGTLEIILITQTRLFLIM